MIEGHGDDIYSYNGRIRYNFSSNICGSQCLDELMGHLAGNPALMGSYPEPYPRTLEAAIAGNAGVDAECVMVTNGATEAIYLIARAFMGTTSAIVSPTFSEYEDACVMYGHAVTHVGSVRDLPSQAAVAWVCNPNNPTGKIVPLSELRAAATCSGRLLVVDQAYSDYTLSPVMDAAEAVRCGNVILLGSFTKRYSVPGLRIGYAIGDRHLMAKVRKSRMPWSVNALAIEAARFLMSDSRFNNLIDAGALHCEALRLAGALRGMGIEVSATDCNFMLCQLPSGSAGDMKEWLVNTHGLLIRDASNFHGLTPQHFRVAAQSRDADDLLVNAIKEWMSR